MPDFGRARVSTDRFRGLRCVHTHLLGEKLTQDDLTDLALLRFDLMSAVEVDKVSGLPGLVYSAHLVPADGTHENDVSKVLNGSPTDSLPYEFLDPAIPAASRCQFHTTYQFARGGDGSRSPYQPRKGAGS